MIPPPKWKMFLITFPSAYILSSAIVPMLQSLFPDWPFLTINAIATVLLVFLLTYVALPLSTSLLSSWLEVHNETGSYTLDILQEPVQKSLSSEAKRDAIRSSERAVHERGYLDDLIYGGASVSTFRSTQRLRHLANHRKSVTGSLTQYYPRV